MAMKKLIVRNVRRATDGEDLERLFAPFGEVSSAVIVPPADPGQEHADAIVEMGSDAQAQAALDALDGQEHGGRRLSVDWAEPADESAAGQPRMFTPMNMPDDARRRPEWPASPPPPPGTGPRAGGFGDRGGEGGGGGGGARRAPRP